METLQVQESDILEENAAQDEWAEDTIRDYRADLMYWEPGLVPDDPFSTENLDKINCGCCLCQWERA